MPIHIATVSASAVIGHPGNKGDPEIIRHLLEALTYHRKLPAFSRGQLYFDFDLGKVRIAAAQ